MHPLSLSEPRTSDQDLLSSVDGNSEAPWKAANSSEDSLPFALVKHLGFHVPRVDHLVLRAF